MIDSISPTWSPRARAFASTLASLGACALAVGSASSCSTSGTAAAPDAAAADSAPTPAPSDAPSAAAASADPQSPDATPPPPTGPDASASAAVSAEPEPAPAPEPPPVEVKNIGMHIGGGPNDAETKAPIKTSVSPHFDEFARCFAKVEDPSKSGDFGVDLRIPKDGGKAEVSHPRTALDGDEFKSCVVSTFEAIDFNKPKGGATVVSYSLRFTPTKR